MSNTDEVPLPRMLKPRELPPLPRSTEAFMPPSERAILRTIEQELSRTPLDEIAVRTAKLVYGDVKALAEGIGADPDKIWQWAISKNPD